MWTKWLEICWYSGPCWWMQGLCWISSSKGRSPKDLKMSPEHLQQVTTSESFCSACDTFGSSSLYGTSSSCSAWLYCLDHDQHLRLPDFHQDGRYKCLLNKTLLFFWTFLTVITLHFLWAQTNLLAVQKHFVVAVTAPEPLPLLNMCCLVRLCFIVEHELFSPACQFTYQRNTSVESNGQPSLTNRMFSVACFLCVII